MGGVTEHRQKEIMTLTSKVILSRSPLHRRSGQCRLCCCIMLPVFLLTVSFNKMAFSMNCIPDIIVVSRVSLI
jgi:hypothetical protein